jgi:hypothetical protein
MTSNGAVSQPPPAEWLDGPLPPDLTPQQAALYDEIAAHLRVPFLGGFWRALTWDPETFAPLWKALGPLLLSRAFEREAAQLREAAIIDEAITMPSHQAFKADLVRAEIDFEMRDRIGNYNAAVAYVLPKTLLAAVWLRSTPPGRTAADRTDDPVPAGVAPGAVAVPPAPPEQVRGRLAELLEEIPREHGHAVADEYFRAIGRMTDYLNIAWNAIRPVVRDEPYDERARMLVRQAEDGLSRLPRRTVELDRIGTPDRVTRYRSILMYYAQHHLPDILMDVAMIKGLTDGPERARECRFDQQ